MLQMMMVVGNFRIHQFNIQMDSQMEVGLILRLEYSFHLNLDKIHYCILVVKVLKLMFVQKVLQMDYIQMVNLHLKVHKWLVHKLKVLMMEVHMMSINCKHHRKMVLKQLRRQSLVIILVLLQPLVNHLHMALLVLLQLLVYHLHMSIHYLHIPSLQP
jgi:hypothetical protein